MKRQIDVQPLVISHLAVRPRKAISGAASCCCGNSATVLSLFSAASATCALSAGVSSRLVLLVVLLLLVWLLPQPFVEARPPLRTQAKIT